VGAVYNAENGQPNAYGFKSDREFLNPLPLVELAIKQ
jgi:hypothetical protein